MHVLQCISCYYTLLPSPISSYDIAPTSSSNPPRHSTQSPSPMSSYNGISSTPTDTTFRSSHLQSQPSPSAMSSEDESSASFEIVVPLAAGLTVTATIIAIVLLVTITFGVAFFIKKSKNKSKRESTTLSSGDMYINTSPNTVYKAFEKYTSDKATEEVNDDDYEKIDPAETAVTTENNDQQLYEEIDESVIFNSNDSQYDN
ncbi:hypothetical protein GBAR_LOCUS20795 [Geodia barretti]|uniref:Uncharacterized protein n=1 Tax=Geodia barretti TaxID=519541 RepID=A0AA35SXB6_GEOBA|nr:hypothetical protein GBAR_LOCUS20795 [Geodia barretti]